MRFYTKAHRYYCGIDLHVRNMYVCVVDEQGQVCKERNLRAKPEALLKFLEPFREDVVVGVECIYTWYWVADLCADQGIDFVLGHALYMGAIHGGKTKSDRIDAQKIARLLRGGNFPLAFVYPREMRPARDLLRRRHHLMRKRSEVLAHITMTNQQYNLPAHGKKLTYPANRQGALEMYCDPVIRTAIAADLEILQHYDHLLSELEVFILRQARRHDARALALITTIPGVGKIIGLTLLYEIQDIRRFPSVQQFASYARLVVPVKTSDGKVVGRCGRKMGNSHLKWAFSEAAVSMMSRCPQAKELVERKTQQHGKGKAISLLAHKIGRAVYFMLRRHEGFKTKEFFVD